jgi:hypothetical protein
MVISFIYIFFKYLKKEEIKEEKRDLIEESANRIVDELRYKNTKRGIDQLKEKNKILDFPKVVEKKEEEKKKKYWMLLVIDTTLPDITYGIKTVRSSEPFKKVTENLKFRNFVSWYNNGKTPFFCLRFTDGSMTFVERRHIVGFKVTFGEDEE